MDRLSFRVETRPLDTREGGEIAVPAGQVVLVELAQVVVPAGTGHDLHQFGAGLKEVGQPPGGDIDFQALAQFRLLGGDARGAEVGVADSGSDTADGLHGGVGDGHAIGPEGECLDEIGMDPQATGYDQGDASTCSGLVEAMRAFQREGVSVPLRVAYLPTALPVFLTDGLLRFQKARRDVCVMISEMNPRQQEAALRKGELDLALLGHPWPELMREFTVERLHKTPVGVVMPAGHSLAQRRSVELTELREAPFVSLSESAFPTRVQMLEEIFGKAGFDPLVIMKANGLSELLGMVSTGAGIALVPMELEKIAPPGLAFVKLRQPRFTLQFCAVWKAGPCDPVIRELIRYLR